MKYSHQLNRNTQQGIVLLEALIAILIFSMGILALIGLQATMVQNTSDAKYRADAAFIAQQKIGMIWANPSNLSSYVETNKDISALIPNGTSTVTLPAAGGEVKVVITWRVPGQDSHTYTANARITGG